MKFKILQSRDMFILIEEENNIVGIFKTLELAKDKIRNLEYVQLMHLLMTDY